MIFSESRKAKNSNSNTQNPLGEKSVGSNLELPRNIKATIQQPAQAFKFSRCLPS